MMESLVRQFRRFKVRAISTCNPLARVPGYMTTPERAMQNFYFPGRLHMNRGQWIAPALLLVLSLPLSAQENNQPPAGFTALFNGKDLSGWQGGILITKRLKMSPEE